MLTSAEIIALLNGSLKLGNPNRGIEYEDILFAQFLDGDNATRSALWESLNGALLELWASKNAESFSRATLLIARLNAMSDPIRPQNPATYFSFIGAAEPELDEANEGTLRLAMDSVRILQLFELRSSLEYWQSKFKESLTTLQLSESSFAAYYFLYASLGLLKTTNGLKPGQVLDILVYSILALKMPKLELYSILTALKDKIEGHNLVDMVKEEYKASIDTVSLGSVSTDDAFIDNINILRTVINIWLKDMGESLVQYTQPSLATPRQILKDKNIHVEMAI
jgi:hypothetical protein